MFVTEIKDIPSQYGRHPNESEGLPCLPRPVLQKPAAERGAPHSLLTSPPIDGQT